MSTLRAPFPWFGGKSRVAPQVWERLGNVSTYNEPFAGSLAVLLGRPHEPRVETVNDLDCYLANFWRALQHDPEQVAYHADSPVNEADLHARHRWLVKSARERAEKVITEPEFYDAKIAGWWVWGQCLWIGSGWCQSSGKHANGAGATQIVEWETRPDLSSATGRGGLMSSQRTMKNRSGENPCEQRKRPASSRTGTSVGVHRQGLHRRRWQGGGQAGQGSGVHAVGLTRQIPDVSGADGAAGRGIHASAFTRKTGGLYDYMESLAIRLRRVRVCCGDWSRILTPSVTTYIGTCGVFLDPPYEHALRERCYSEDHNISAAVRTWALEHGDDPKFRIALCGYEGEHAMPENWETVAWKAHGGYSRTVRGRANRERERIWFSPHCLRPDHMLQFDEATA